MKILIIKLGASGDIIRTTTLLHILTGEIHWLTTDANLVLVEEIFKIHKCIPWSKKNSLVGSFYNLVINLEESKVTAELITQLKYNELFGTYLDDANTISYTENAKEWFDLSIISSLGKKRSDFLKLKNRKTYQELIYQGLGYQFKDEKYFLPKPIDTGLSGDIAIAPKAGKIWPMKNWAFYSELKSLLEKDGFKVNYLPIRESLLEHFADVKNHTYLISGDSMPMHIALGFGIKCLSIFTCTSPWEIHGYNVQKKLISKRLEDFFYRRFFNEEATTSISLEEVYSAASEHFN